MDVLNLLPLRGIPRRATQRRTGEAPESRLLAEWRSEDCYVLLGDPGSGKSWCFARESADCSGLLLNARDVVDGVAPEPQSGQTVFIDGLDEVRAGATDGRIPFGEIRRWLVRVGRPQFRLSCREADWLGDSDRDALMRISPRSTVSVLHLDALNDDEARDLLRARGEEVPDAEEFWRRAERMGLIALFGNPLHGVYVVLWFGDHPRSASDGVRPRCAAEMQSRLEAQLSEPDRARIAIKVVDLSLAPAA